MGYNPQIISSGRRLNDNMARYAARSIIKRMSKIGINVAMAKVAVFGLTFKENCPDIRNSKIFDMIRELKSWGIEVVAHDPWANCQDVKTNYQLEPVTIFLMVNLMRSL